MDRDGLVVAESVAGAPTVDTPFARLETPQDTAAHRRAQKRFPFELFFFICATGLQAFNLGAHWELAQEINQLHINATALNSTFTNVTALVAEYDALIALDKANVDKYCDVPYFATNGFGFIQQNLLSLRDAALAFFYLGVIPSVGFFFYKLGHLRHLYAQRSRSLFETWHSVKNPEKDPIDKGIPLDNYNNPLGRVRIGDVSVAGQIRRAERFALRGETSGYVVIQIFHDIPLVLIFFLYIAFVERYRGLNCAECFVNGKLCEVPYYFSLTFTDSYVLKVAMGACFLHIGWNYLTLSFRWIYYFQTFDPPWNYFKQFFCWFLSTLVFATSFLCPVAILFVAYVGPFYYGFNDLTGGIALSSVGGGFWSLGFLTFVWIAGLEVGEGIFSGLFCCNFWEIFYFALPCLDYCEESCTICEIGCDNCCCCCC